MSTAANDLLDLALGDPTRVFMSPGEVVLDERLSRWQKLVVLTGWEADARALSVAEEENMTGGEPNRLREVLLAKHRLGPTEARARAAPTKHGG